MKNKVTYLLIASMLLAFCSQKQPNTQVSQEEYSFPVFIDNEPVVEDTIIDPMFDKKHYLLHIGKLCDTLLVNHDIRPGIPLGTPVYAENHEKRSKGRYDNYFWAWAIDHNYKHWDSVGLDIQIDTNQTVTNRSRKAYPVLIENLHNDTVQMGYGNSVPVITEALNEQGKWRPIERLHFYACGVGVNTIILPPNQFAVTSTLVYSGSFKTKLRLRIGQNYSKEFSGSINKTQFIPE